MVNLEVTKMHGLGNSYVIVPDLDKKIEERYSLSLLARALSDKNYGVGSDGLLVHQEDQSQNVMRVFNPDGSEAEMCGNGIRMFARYLYESKYAPKNMSVKTLAGIVEPEVILKKGKFESVKVNMGRGKILGEEELHFGEYDFYGTKVSVGNPHYVVFKHETPGRYHGITSSSFVSEEAVRDFGPRIENHPNFQPSKTNVEFAEIWGRDKIKLLVWERGAGYTKACGTGACATAFAARKSGKINKNVNVNMLGGNLKISVKSDDTIFMTGPAEYIFKGQIVDIEEMLAHFK